jgi:Rrf2 family nitric oxide-sensitive transcriptional repressor
LKTVGEIARKIHITKPFATKIIHQLKNRNLVKTVQGKLGGNYLGNSPENISIFDVLNAMGFDSTINECLHNPILCPLEATCKIHCFFIEQENALINNLKNAKIVDFAFTDSDLIHTNH